MARPAATSSRTNSGVISAGMRWGKRRKTEGVKSPPVRRSVSVELAESGVLLSLVRTLSVAMNRRAVVHRSTCLALAIFARPMILADGDEFHLRRDDAGAGVGELRDDFARLGAERTAALAGQTGKFDRGDSSPPCWRIRRVCRRDSRCPCGFTSRPSCSSTSPRFKIQSRRSAGRPSSDLPVKCGIAPRPGAIIDAHRRILRYLRRCKTWSAPDFDLAHRHADVVVQACLRRKLFWRRAVVHCCAVRTNLWWRS